MDPKLLELDSYIKKHRAQGESDDLILEKLTNAGWDRGLVFRRLSSEEIPAPPSSVSLPQNPLQIENVQVNGGSSQTRIGILTLFMSVSLFIAGFFVFAIFTDVRKFIFSLLQWGEFDPQEVKRHFVVYISVLVPLVVILTYCYRRVNRIILEENPLAVNDAFYRRNIRASLRIALIISSFLSIVLVYAILSPLLLNETFSKEGVTDTGIAFIVLSLIAAFFWHFSKKSAR